MDESWMSHVIHVMDELCHTSDIWVMDESWRSRGWVVDESWVSHITENAAMPRFARVCQHFGWTGLSHVTCVMDESCHMCDGWVMSHVWRMSSRVAISHGWVIDESCHRKCRDDAVLEYANVNTEALVSLDKRFARYTQQLKTSVRGAAKHKMQVCVWVEDANVWQASAWVWDASAWQVSVWV